MFALSALRILGDLPDTDHDEWLWMAEQMCLEKMKEPC